MVDHLGTVRDLAKQDGTIAVHYKYDSFGNVTSGDTSKTRYLFTSREIDTATKLQYNRARYHDPAVGRWISEDWLGFGAGDGNLGRYVRNASNGSIDPSGLDEFGTGGGLLRDRRVVRVYQIRSMWDDYDEAVTRGWYRPGWYVWLTAPIAKIFLPRSEPDIVYVFDDGSRRIVLGGGPSSGDMVNQALALNATAKLATGGGKMVAGALGMPTTTSTTIASIVTQGGASVSDDALVNFGRVARSEIVPSTGVRSYWFRYGDIKHLTPPQLQAVIGDLASAGQPGGASVMRVSGVSASEFTMRPPSNMAGIPEFTIDMPVTVGKNVPIVK